MCDERFCAGQPRAMAATGSRKISAVTVGRVRVAEGRHSEAESALRHGFEVVMNTDFNWPKSMLALELAECLLSQGRGSEALAALAEVEPWIRRAGCHLWDERLAAIHAQLGIDLAT